MNRRDNRKAQGEHAETQNATICHNGLGGVFLGRDIGVAGQWNRSAGNPSLCRERFHVLNSLLCGRSVQDM
jgi:hypothetical protein